jgi:hypothetical protein
MSPWILRLIFGIGFIFLGYAIMSFGTHTNLLAIPLLIPEGVGLVMMTFCAGYWRFRWFLILSVSSFIAATVFDPFVWQVFILAFPHASLASVIVNGILGLVTVVFYLLGSTARRRFDRKIVK